MHIFKVDKGMKKGLKTEFNQVTIIKSKQQFHLRMKQVHSEFIWIEVDDS